MSTIAAIGTSLGNSGINIIRISGDNSNKIVKNIFSNYKKLEPNTIHYGKIIYENEVVDNVLVSYFKSPNSFTGEDVYEINCHGGIYITKKILDIVIKNGAQLAEPGEFSKRAFLNGKMDLSEAEAIIDLINSKTELESRIATNQLNGKLYEDILLIREEMVNILAQIDVNVDYPEYDYEQLQSDKLNELLYEVIIKLKKLALTYNQGKYIKNGVNVAIIGRPNVGKSSMLNLMCGENRAIVTDIEGTTRDVISESVNIGDLILNINDTAGIRDTDDIIEKIGVEKSINMLENVDLVLFLFDPKDGINEYEKNIIAKIENKGIKCLYLINKIDKYEKLIYDTFLSQIEKIEKNNILYISVKEEKGIEELKLKIKQMFLNNEINNMKENVLVNERHKNLIDESVIFLEKAKNEINKNIPIDMVSLNIKESAKSLGKIIGSDISVDVANKVFEKFCIGK